MTSFFLIFLITIIVTRIALFLCPIASPTVKGFRIHHWMYGIFLIVLGIVLSSIVLYAIGLGLFVDELTYILIGGTSHKDNYSTVSLVGTVIFIIIVYIFQLPLLAIL